MRKIFLFLFCFGVAFSSQAKVICINDINHLENAINLVSKSPYNRNIIMVKGANIYETRKIEIIYNDDKDLFITGKYQADLCEEGEWFTDIELPVEDLDLTVEVVDAHVEEIAGMLDSETENIADEGIESEDVNELENIDLGIEDDFGLGINDNANESVNLEQSVDIDLSNISIAEIINNGGAVGDEGLLTYEDGYLTGYKYGVYFGYEDMVQGYGAREYDLTLDESLYSLPYRDGYPEGFLKGYVLGQDYFSTGIVSLSPEFKHALEDIVIADVVNSNGSIVSEGISTYEDGYLTGYKYGIYFGHEDMVQGYGQREYDLNLDESLYGLPYRDGYPEGFLRGYVLGKNYSSASENVKLPAQSNGSKNIIDYAVLEKIVITITNLGKGNITFGNIKILSGGLKLETKGDIILTNLDVKDSRNITVKGANISIIDSEFFNNSSAKGGGIRTEFEEDLSILDTTFEDNLATNMGGGILVTIPEEDAEAENIDGFNEETYGESGGNKAEEVDVEVNVEEVSKENIEGDVESFDTKGVTSIKKKKYPEAKFINVRVINNVARIGGGIYFNADMKVNYIGCEIARNKALNSSQIRYKGNDDNVIETLNKPIPFNPTDSRIVIIPGGIRIETH